MNTKITFLDRKHDTCKKQNKKETANKIFFLMEKRRLT